MMNDEVEKLKQEAEYARLLYTINSISREEAQKRIQPYIDAINERSVEIAKKYNQKPKKVSFNGFIR
jgi:LPS O-antigen subunit length determinant protein (WzzB/FepE family)